MLNVIALQDKTAVWSNYPKKAIMNDSFFINGGFYATVVYVYND
jgi:hypothetical protein